MALFTKLFKRSHDPYELGGRWHRFRIKNDALVLDDESRNYNAAITTDNSSYLRLSLQNCIPLQAFIVPIATPTSTISTQMFNMYGSDVTNNLRARMLQMGCSYNSQKIGGIGLALAGRCSDYYIYVYVVESE